MTQTVGALLVPQDFPETFRHATAKFILEEERAAAAEAHLRKERQEALQKELRKRVEQPILRRQRRIIFSAAFLIAVCLGIMIFFTTHAFTQTEGPQLLQAVGFCCASAPAAPWGVAARLSRDVILSLSIGRRKAVTAARPELRGYQASVGTDRDDVSELTLLVCVCCIPLLASRASSQWRSHGLENFSVGILVLWLEAALLACAFSACGCLFLGSLAGKCPWVALLAASWPDISSRLCSSEVAEVAPTFKGNPGESRAGHASAHDCF